MEAHTTNTNDSLENISLSIVNNQEKERSLDVMFILSLSIAAVGIFSNLTVVIAFLPNKKLRIKIPNMFIINQVSLIFI